MQSQPGSQFQPSPQPSGRAQLHSGVREFMNGVYGWMAVGIAITAAVAYGISQDENTLRLLFGSGLRWVVLFGPLAMAWFLPARIPNMDRGMAIGVFAVFAALLGAAMSYIPLVYSAGSILGVFVATVGMFAGMALFGYTTKKDLTGVGQFMIMALIGVVAASLINFFFLKSGMMSMVVSAIVAVLAAGLTAYHTQAIKQLYLVSGRTNNLAILGALMLYVDFINLFLSLLRLFGGSRD